MQDVMLFCSGMLQSLASFLGSVPIIYFIGLFMFLYVVKAFKILVS